MVVVDQIGASDQVDSVSDKEDKQEVARLERVNQELSDSLKRCRKLLHDYEVRLTANSNDPQASRQDEESREG